MPPVCPCAGRTSGCASPCTFLPPSRASLTHGSYPASPARPALQLFETFEAQLDLIDPELAHPSVSPKNAIKYATKPTSHQPTGTTADTAPCAVAAL